MKASVADVSSQCCRQTIGTEQTLATALQAHVCNVSKGREQETPWLQVPMATESEASAIPQIPSTLTRQQRGQLLPAYPRFSRALEWTGSRLHSNPPRQERGCSMAGVEMASSPSLSCTCAHRTELAGETCSREGGHCLSLCIVSQTS